MSVYDFLMLESTSRQPVSANQHHGLKKKMMRTGNQHNLGNLSPPKTNKQMNQQTDRQTDNLVYKCALLCLVN